MAHTEAGEGGRSKVTAASPTDDGTIQLLYIKIYISGCTGKATLQPKPTMGIHIPLSFSKTDISAS